MSCVSKCVILVDIVREFSVVDVGLGERNDSERCATVVSLYLYLWGLVDAAERFHRCER